MRERLSSLGSPRQWWLIVLGCAQSGVVRTRFVVLRRSGPSRDRMARGRVICSAKAHSRVIPDRGRSVRTPLHPSPRQPLRRGFRILSSLEAPANGKSGIKWPQSPQRINKSIWPAYLLKVFGFVRCTHVRTDLVLSVGMVVVHLSHYSQTTASFVGP